MPAACFLEDVMPHETMELGATGNDAQEFLENTLLSRLVCFFCDKEFRGMQVLHSHQNECALASDSQKILTDTKNSVGKKRTFLSSLHLIPKVNAERVRSEKRKDVVLDVIVIDDDSDDENVEEDKSQRYLLSPNSVDAKTKQNGRLRSKSKNNGLASGSVFTKHSSKVFKFDISSPLGMRLRYYSKQLGDCRLPTSKVITANYEQYCATSGMRTARSNKCYHVTYRKSRQPSKFCHQYKFTRAQWTEYCKARCSGLNLSSLQLKRRMKPCRVSLEKLDLPSDDPTRGTFDANKFIQMLNLKSAVDNFTKTLDEEVAVAETPNVEEKRETFIVPTCGLVNVFGGLQGFEMNEAGIGKMKNWLKRPIKKIGAYQSYCLRKPDAGCSTVDMYSPVVVACSGLVEPASKHVKPPQAFARNVEFVPITALNVQNVFEAENHDPQTQLFQISSVYSLAKTQTNTKSLSNGLAKEQQISESVACAVETCRSTSASSAGVVTIADQEKAPLEANEKPTEITERRSVIHSITLSASDVIDLTENVSSSPPDDLETTPSFSRESVADGSIHKTSGVLRDISQQLAEKLCSRSFDKPQNTAEVHKLSTVKTSAQQTSQLRTELEKPFVIEIPDEDSAVFSEQQRNYAAHLHNNNNNNNNKDLVNTDRIATLPSQRVHDKNWNSVPQTWHSVQPNVPPGGRNDIHTSDTIDLSFDSDSESLDKGPVASERKRPFSSNIDSCPPRKRARPGVSLEQSSLPPLTFKCHICSSLFNFDINSGAMIRNHYLMHNVTNVELVRQLRPGGQMTWSLVELNNTLAQPTHSKPSDHTTSTSVHHTDAASNRVGIAASLTRPAVTLHYNPPMMSSSRSAVREGNTLPEFVSAELSRVPGILSSTPDMLSARKRSSPNATRLNSEKNCNMLPVGQARSAPALRVADVNSSKITGDTVLLQAGGKERKEVPFQTRNVDVNTLRAMHLTRLRPIVPNSRRAFAGSVPVATATSAQPSPQFYFPTSASFNRMHVEEGQGDVNAGNQAKSKHNPVAPIQSNNGVICLD